MKLKFGYLKVDVGGEGSRGGIIIGRTSSGKPIYQSSKKGNVLSREEQIRANTNLKRIRSVTKPQAHQAEVFGPEVSTKDVGIPRGNVIVGTPVPEGKGKKRRIRIADIRAPQSTIPRGGLSKFIKSPPKVLPGVVEHEGDFVLISGHTRIGAAALAGREFVEVEVFPKHKGR